jgi:lysozyme family protein
MADFLTANKYILENEGGYANVPGDSGGETYAGISRKNFPNWSGWGTIDDNKPLKNGQLIQDPNLASAVNMFYKKQFWDGLLGDGIDSQAVATYLYDFYVNAMHNAVKCLQRIVGVTDDGAFGNGTLNAVNAYQGDLLAELHKARCDYYTRIATNGSAKFLQGWLNRANKMYDILSA